ncbi:MAG: hydrogenase maturation protease [Calditrichaeota bacterium]|nr:MAG: hydrogenase maturation protease [Calditrichota bacterium]
MLPRFFYMQINRTKNSAPVLLIGVGNDFRCDDAVGLNLARRFEQENLPGLDVLVEANDMLSLLEIWTDREQVYLCDAVMTAQPPGTIIRIDAFADNFQSDLSRFSSHSFGLNEIIMLGLRLKQLPKKLFFYGITGADFGFGKRVTPAVKHAEILVFKELCAKLKSVLSTNKVSI